MSGLAGIAMGIVECLTIPGLGLPLGLVSIGVGIVSIGFGVGIIVTDYLDDKREKAAVATTSSHQAEAKNKQLGDTPRPSLTNQVKNSHAVSLEVSLGNGNAGAVPKRGTFFSSKSSVEGAASVRNSQISSQVGNLGVVPKIKGGVFFGSQSSNNNLDDKVKLVKTSLPLLRFL